MKLRTEKNGSTCDDWATPDYIYDWIKENYGSDYFDPCPLKHNKDLWNGLTIDWKDLNYVNPPYNNRDKVKFILKAYEEYKKGKISILLIPASTDINIFHNIIFPNANIYFIKGRVKFKGFNSLGNYVENKCGQSGSMLVVFDPTYSIREIKTIEFDHNINKKVNNGIQEKKN